MPCFHLTEAGLLLCYQLQILIRRRSAYPAYPRQFRYIHLSITEGGIVLMENSRNVILGGGPPPNTPAFCFGVLYTAFHTRPYHCQLQLAEHASHLKKCFAHGVCLSVPAVDGDASHNHQPQMLGAYYLYQFAHQDRCLVSSFLPYEKLRKTRAASTKRLGFANRFGSGSGHGPLLFGLINLSFCRPAQAVFLFLLHCLPHDGFNNTCLFIMEMPRAD